MQDRQQESLGMDPVVVEEYNEMSTNASAGDGLHSGSQTQPSQVPEDLACPVEETQAPHKDVANDSDQNCEKLKACSNLPFYRGCMSMTFILITERFSVTWSSITAQTCSKNFAPDIDACDEACHQHIYALFLTHADSCWFSKKTFFLEPPCPGTTGKANCEAPG
jgi:hypothetical protein